MYVTDALSVIAENTSRYAGGSHMAVRWYDAINPHTEEERTGAEIAADVIRRAGLVVKNEFI